MLTAEHIEAIRAIHENAVAKKHTSCSAHMQHVPLLLAALDAKDAEIARLKALCVESGAKAS